MLKNLLILLICALSITGCDKNSDAIYSQNDNQELHGNDFVKVSNMRIFFGHQSVGSNILDGISTVNKKSEANFINVVKIDSYEQINDSGLYHAWIGENLSPQSKIDDFKELIQSGIGNNVDFALMKFCYLDFNKMTNIEKVFASYSNAIMELQQEYPEVTFIHVTTPLISNNMTIKDWIKKILGRSEKNDADNVARNKYNVLIRNRFDGREPILDLAEYESTYPNGKRNLFSFNDTNYEAMVPGYTDDGGHLNSLGKKIVATKTLNFFEELYLVDTINQ